MRETLATPGGGLPCRDERRRPGVRWYGKRLGGIGREGGKEKSERLTVRKEAKDWLLAVQHGCGRPPFFQFPFYRGEY